MILMSAYLLGEIPFKTVYLHGLVTDKDGKKISKSMGNNLDPLDLIKDYGADAVRMALVVGVGPGNDSKISLEKVKAYKLFSNKLWNIARFILSSAEGVAPDPAFSAYVPADNAHLGRLNALVAESSQEMDEYKFYLVGEKLYAYAWHELADRIIEESKPIIGGFGTAAGGTAQEQTSRRQSPARPIHHPEAPASVHAFHHRRDLGRDAVGRSRKRKAAPLGRRMAGLNLIKNQI